jgi:nicotinamide riboside transporter PnuC
MSAIEIGAVLLGIANILLIIRRSVWNFPVAIAMVALFFDLCRAGLHHRGVNYALIRGEGDERFDAALAAIA